MPSSSSESFLGLDADAAQFIDESFLGLGGFLLSAMKMRPCSWKHGGWLTALRRTVPRVEKSDGIARGSQVREHDFCLTSFLRSAVVGAAARNPFGPLDRQSPIPQERRVPMLQLQMRHGLSHYWHAEAGGHGGAVASKRFI